MARLQLLIPLMLWITWLGAPPAWRRLEVIGPAWGVAIYLLSLAVIVVVTRRLARRAMDVTTAGQNDALSRFHLTLFVLRWLLLAAHATALFLLGWGDAVTAICGPLFHQIDTLPAMLSIAPIVLAWIGLSWAQYPLDRAVREQNVLWAFESEQPLHAIPTLREYVSNALRTNVLVTILPVAAVMLLRDALHVGLRRTELNRDAAELITTFLPISLVILLAPELLRRIFPTESLPPSPLRDRLEQMCRRLRLRYRDILLWHTHHAIGNAAVMGLVPQVRYVLLSDLIIETMSERQIEAVFAHEAGHVKHRHLTWFAIFTVTALLSLDLLGVGLSNVWPALHAPAWLPMDAVAIVLWLALFFLALGALSRQFERQADLFAARSVASHEAADQPADLPSPTHGADVFNSALVHVARINNMPLDGGSFHGRGSKLRRLFGWLVHYFTAWRHGSIRSRIVHLQELTLDPIRSKRFDRRMVVLRVALLIGFLASGAWAVEAYWRTPNPNDETRNPNQIQNPNDETKTPSSDFVIRA